MDEVLTAVAQQVVEVVGRRTYDAHRIFNDRLLSHLFYHEMLVRCPELKTRLWPGYRLWPEESSENAGCWIEATADQPAIAIEIVCDDPADHSRAESSGVWGRIIADVLKLSTAMAFRNLGTGYVLLFGELQLDQRDQRIARFPLVVDGCHHRVQSTELLSSAMDAGFFEELMHPQESTPAAFDLRLLARQTQGPIGFWLWSVNLPSE